MSDEGPGGKGGEAPDRGVQPHAAVLLSRSPCPALGPAHPQSCPQPSPGSHTCCALPSPCPRSNGADYSWLSCEYWDATAWSDAADAVLATRGVDTSKYK